MLKRILKMIIGVTIASFSISCTIKAGLGVFPGTSANIALSNWTGISIGQASIIVELIMLAIATKMKEGIGLTSIVNAIYGGIMTDVFNLIIPSNPLVILGLPLMIVGWGIMDKAGFGNCGSNMLTTAILKRSNKSIGFIRTMIECGYLLVGLLGARNQITLFTLALSFGFGYLMKLIYKLMKHDPTKVEHMYLIKGKGREKVVECSSFKDEEK